jgi:hypothetical protein
MCALASSLLNRAGYEDVEPETIKQCLQRFSNAVRVDMVIPALRDQSAAQLDRCIQTLHVQGRGAFAIGLALLGLSEEGEPDGQLATVADAAVEMRVDDGGKLSVWLKIGVIPPFLTGCIRRTYAAIFSFCAGVMPPMPMFGQSLL